MINLNIIINQNALKRVTVKVDYYELIKTCREREYEDAILEAIKAVSHTQVLLEEFSSTN
jgi:hypothetical protein